MRHSRAFKRIPRVVVAAALAAAAITSPVPTSAAAAEKGTGSGCPPLFSQLRNPSAEPAALTEFKLRHRQFPAVSPTDNLRWIVLAETSKNPETGKRVFLDAENAILKWLNDSGIKDKDLVTALTHRFKELLLTEIEKDPSLKKATRARYSDYKALRLIFDGDLRRLKPRINKSYLNAARAFEREVSSLPIAYHSQAPPPSTWHLAGIGETADEAGVAARDAREKPRAASDSLAARTFTQALPRLQRDLGELASLRAAVDQPRFDPLLAPVPDFPSRRTLSARAFEAIRKNKELDPPALAQKLSLLYRMVLSPDDATLLRRYVTLVDARVPGVRISERVVIPVDRAKHGIVSIDFAGQNSRNLRAAAEALASHEGEDIRKVILPALRLSERKATLELTAYKAEVERHATFPVAQDEGKRAVYFTGDDGNIFPDRPMRLKEEREFLRNLAENVGFGKLRVVFLPERDLSGQWIAAADRSNWIYEGEEFEKELRKRLELQLGLARSDQILFGMEASPDGRGGLAIRILSRTLSPDSELRKTVESEAQALARDKGYSLLKGTWDAPPPGSDQKPAYSR